MKNWLKIVICLSIFVGGYFLGFFTFEPVMRAKWEHKQNVKVEKFTNKTAPNVETKLLTGQNWSLAEQKGKVVVVDFWATWCGPCVASLPEMKKLYQKYENNPQFQLVGISLDENVNDVHKLLDEKQIEWSQICNKECQTIADDFSITGIPSVWVIDQNGIIRGVDMYDHQKIEELVKKLLATE